MAMYERAHIVFVLFKKGTCSRRWRRALGVKSFTTKRDRCAQGRSMIAALEICDISPRVPGARHRRREQTHRVSKEMITPSPRSACVLDVGRLLLILKKNRGRGLDRSSPSTPPRGQNKATNREDTFDGWSTHPTGSKQYPPCTRPSTMDYNTG